MIMTKIPPLNYFAETFKEYLEAWEGTQKALSEKIGIIPSHISEMKKGTRRCTPEYDLRLSCFFSVKPGYFMQLQTRYDMEKISDHKAEEIRKSIQPMIKAS